MQETITHIHETHTHSATFMQEPSPIRPFIEHRCFDFFGPSVGALLAPFWPSDITKRCQEKSLLSKADRLAELGRSGQGIKELSKERDDGESTNLSQEDPSVVESAASALFNRITRIA